MKNELRHGRLKYISFLIIDLVCVVLSNILAVRLYLGFADVKYSMAEHIPVIYLMLLVDIIVTAGFNTLREVLRRRKRIEILETFKHVAISFVLLAMILFTTKSGAEYSRMIVFLAYFLEFVLMLGCRYIWKKILMKAYWKNNSETALLMTTDSFATEALSDLRKAGVDAKSIFLLDSKGQKSIDGVPVCDSIEDAIAVLGWDLAKNVYIYGLDHQMIPDALAAACREMKVKIDFVNFKYKIIDVKTVKNDDSRYGSLSFIEGKRDIPFPIRRVYWITETEADLHRGHHAHKLNCQLLFCPHGKIDIILDDGEKKETVTLDEPGKGLLLMPGLWREMIWQESGSVLCVLASEYYDPDEYIRNYDGFIAYNNEDGRKKDN